MQKEQNVLADIVENIEKVIIGKRWAVELIVLAMASGGHVLIEDIPGVGKTSLVSALSRSVSCSFKRIQFNPDILPSDITGFSVYNQKSGEFDFHPGAAMSNFVLADEINRATSKTQSSLLEIMDENQVTVDSKTYRLEEPFMVLATQNPIEYLGTYPLPEAQIDRFLIKVSIGYPSELDEVRILGLDFETKNSLQPVAQASDILDVKRAVENIYVDNHIKSYIVEIINRTRDHPEILLGASPRASIALYKICKAFALYSGRDYVIPDDVKLLAPYVLCHRLFLTREAKIEKRTPEQIIADILGFVAVPAVAATRARTAQY